MSKIGIVGSGYVGQAVGRGETIGVLGTSGNSTGYHVHLTLQHVGHGLAGYVIDDVTNPEWYLIS